MQKFVLTSYAWSGVGYKIPEVIFVYFFFNFRGHWDRIPVRHLRYYYELTHVFNRQLRSLKNGARLVLNMQKYTIGQICGENL